MRPVGERLSGLLSPPALGAGEQPGRHTAVVRAGRRRGGIPITGAATDPCPGTAVLRAQMEALERYSAASPGRHVEATSRELGKSALPLDRLPRHAPVELGIRSGTHARLRPDDRIRWTPARRWSDGAEVLLPSIMVYDIAPASSAEDFWVPISTGTAAHFDRTAAVRNALLEVVERDAVALAWLLGSAGPVLTGDEDVSEAARRADTVLTFREITTDVGIPAVLAVLQTPDRRLRRVVGAAARPELTAAATASGLEAMQIHAGLAAALAEGVVPPRTAAQCRRVHDGALLTGAAEHEPHLAVRSVAPTTPLDDGLARENVAGRVTAAGHDVYVADITPPDVAGGGVTVVRAVVPSLQPLSPVFAARYLDSPRFRSRSGGPVDLAAVNPMPYPLA